MSAPLHIVILLSPSTCHLLILQIRQRHHQNHQGIEAMIVKFPLLL